MTTLVRFAPSPTGLLHVGNARTAVMNQLFARAQNGVFILRIDDTDAERSRAEYEAAIHADLAWLGFRVDQVHKQSERGASYARAVEDLKSRGLLYPCYETGEELDRKRKLQRARGLPPVYDRAALDLTPADRAALEAEGRRPHWRFKLSGGRVEWTDLVRGPVSMDTQSVSDPILVRADGSYLYTLPSCVDDVEMGVTHVVRGEDHVTNSGAQVEIFKALGGAPPAFAHTPLLVGADGEKLSKRLGSLSLDVLREAGVEPMALTSVLAKIGTSDAVEGRRDLDALAAEFSFDKIGRAPARFDEADVRRVNAQLLHEASFEDVAERLAAMGVGGDAAFWEVSRANLEVLADAKTWWGVVTGPVAPLIEDAAFAQAAADLVPDGPFDAHAWGAFTDAVKDATGAKGKALFRPLRLALTGQERGPEMAGLFALIGPDKARARLRGESA